MKKFLLLLALFALTSGLFGQSNIIATTAMAYLRARQAPDIAFLHPHPDADRYRDKYLQKIETARYLQVDTDAYRDFFHASPKVMHLHLLSPEGPVTAELYQVELLSPDFVLQTGTGRMLTPSKAIFYRGILAGEPDAIVTASFYEDDFDLVVWGTRDFRIDQVELQVFSVYDEADVRGRGPFPTCQTDLLYAGGPQIRPHQPPSARTNTPNCVGLYIEADHQTYVDNGSSVSNTQNYVYSLYNEVGTFYSQETIPLTISQLVIWDTSDPYTGATSTDEALDLFATQVQDNHQGILCVLLTTRSLGGASPG